MAEVAYSMDEITAGTGGEAVAGRKDEHRLREAFDILAAGGTGALATIYELLSGELFAVSVAHDALQAGTLSPAGAARLAKVLPDDDLVHIVQRTIVAQIGQMTDAIEGQPLGDLLEQGGLFYRTNSELSPGRARLLAWLGFPWRETTLAYLYRRQARSLDIMAMPYVKLPIVVHDRRAPLPTGVFIGPVSDWYWSMVVGRFQGRAAMRRLMRDALLLAARAGYSGAFPADLAGIDDGSPELFCECPPVYRIEPDGAATLSLPGAVPLWRRAMGKLINGAPPLFSWKIALPRRFSSRRPPARR